LSYLTGSSRDRRLDTRLDALVLENVPEPIGVVALWKERPQALHLLLCQSKQVAHSSLLAEPEPDDTSRINRS